MINKIHLCLWFDGNAKEAAEYYCSIFKNATITEDTPMVVMIEMYGKRIMCLNGGPTFKITPAISLFVLCDTVDKTNEIYDKLMQGGNALIPIDKQQWSERYGWVQDKYGMTWQVSVVYQPGDKESMSPSMLFTDKQFGRAEEALKFYTSIFENSSVDVVMHYPEKDQNAGKVLFSEFKLNGYNIIAMDGPGDHKFVFNEGVSFVVNCESQKEIDYFWQKLTDGGEESMCGWLKDKFGVSWQIVPANIGQLMMDPEKSERVMASVLKMKKIDMEMLVNA